MDRTKIKISKLEAARRQLETAIGIYFADGDPVSVHTLAAASHQILVDLDKKGPRTGTFWDFIKTQVRPEYVNKVVKLFAESENFFKHANRDPDEILTFRLSMPEWFLWESVIKYRELAAETPLFMRAYELWFIIRHPDALKPEAQSLVNSLTDFPETNRALFFEHILPVLAKKGIDQKRAIGQ